MALDTSAAHQDEARQVAAVGIQEHRLKTLDPAVLLRARPESLIVPEHLDGLLLAAPDDSSPSR